MRITKVKNISLIVAISLSALCITSVSSAESPKVNSISKDRSSSESGKRCEGEGRSNQISQNSQSRSACPRLTRILITPETNTVDVGTVETLTASAIDQFGNPFLVEPEYRWSATGTGSLVAKGNIAVYTAGSIAETVVITVRLESLSATSTTTVQVPIPGGPTLTSLLVFMFLGLLYILRRNRKFKKIIFKNA